MLFVESHPGGETRQGKQEAPLGQPHLLIVVTTSFQDHSGLHNNPNLNPNLNLNHTHTLPEIHKLYLPNYFLLNQQALKQFRAGFPCRALFHLPPIWL